MKISVLTASYNYAQYIGETIESVLAQTFVDWEMIIVDDGSTDNSLEVIQSYAQKDSRIKVFTHPDGKNHGLAATLQFGLEKAQGEWIAFLESDDLLKPEALEKKVRIAEQNPEVSLIYTDLETLGIGNKTKYLRHFRAGNQALTFPCIWGKRLLKRNLIPTFSVVMVQKEILASCRFDAPVAPWLDYYLWGQMAWKPCFFIPEKLSVWRIHENSFLVSSQEPLLSEYREFYHRLWHFICFPENWLSKLRGSFYCFKKVLRIYRKKFSGRTPGKPNNASHER